MKCLTPLFIKNPDFNNQKTSKSNAAYQDRVTPVRCGKCEGCLKSKVTDWAFRLEQEARHCLYVDFVTLTYSPEFVPLTDSLLPTLKKRDVQLFLKRLRDYDKSNTIRYLFVGEYGTNSYRPHYHGILFNCKEKKNIHKAWEIQSKSIGNVHIGNDISNGAIPYTLKYMYKKGLVPAFEGDDRLPEFRLMSQKLGSKYLSPQVIKWHLDDFKNRQFVVNNQGYKVAMPRYYREQLIKQWGKSRHLLIPDDPKTFMRTDDGDYRNIKSRIQNVRTIQKKFEKTRNQEDRKKL